MEIDNGVEYESVVTPVQLEGAVEDYTSPPKQDSPRTVWFRENRAKLSKKEEEEKAAKEEIMAKARDYIAAFYAERQSRNEKTKKENREDEAKALELKESPEGTAWEQVINMIDFNQGVQQKDVSRARAMLFQAKDANLPVEQI